MVIQRSSNVVNNNSDAVQQQPSQPAPGTTKTCILHKNEQGFGLKVSGSNPVFVAEVKAGGSAQKAGVCKNDIIFKVNGCLATKWEHEKVVQMIQGSGGPYVCLTLIVPPPAEATSSGGADTAPSSSSSATTVIGNNNNNSSTAAAAAASVANNNLIVSSNGSDNKMNNKQPQVVGQGFESVAAAAPAGQVVANIIPKHLAESSSSTSTNVQHYKSSSQDASSSTAGNKKEVSISCPFPLQPHPSASATSPGRNDVHHHHHHHSMVPSGGAGGRKGSAPGGLTITAPLPASPEVQAGLEKSRDKTLRSMIKTQKATIITLKQQEEAARKDGNQPVVADRQSKIEEAENTIKVLKRRLKNMQRNRNKQKAEMSLFPSPAYFDTSASTTHLLVAAEGDAAAAAGNLNPAFLGHQSPPPPAGGLSPGGAVGGNDLVWGQRQPIPHLANPAMIHRRRSGGEGIKNVDGRKKDPKDWFRDDHLINRGRKQLDILHFESDTEEDRDGPMRESAFSDQPALDINFSHHHHNPSMVPPPGHGGHEVGRQMDGVLLRNVSSKSGGNLQKGGSTAAQRSKSSLSSIFLGLNKKSSASVLLPASRSLMTTSQFMLLDTSPSTTDSDDSDLLSSSSSSSDSSDMSDSTDSDSDNNECGTNEEGRRGKRMERGGCKSSDEGHSSQNSGVDLMKLDEDDDPTAASTTEHPCSREGGGGEESFHSAQSDNEEEENVSNIAKNVLRASSLDLKDHPTSGPEDRMKRRINKRRTSNKDGAVIAGSTTAGGTKVGRGGSSGIGSSNEDSIGSKERKVIAAVVGGGGGDGDMNPLEGGQRRKVKTGSNVSTASTTFDPSQLLLLNPSNDGSKRGKNLSNVSSTSESGGHHADGDGRKKRPAKELSPEEEKRRKKIRRNLKLRRMKMRELIKTEKKFGNDLKLLHDLFYYPLKQDLVKSAKNPILGPAEMETLFANLMPLIELHKILYKFLKDQIKPLISSGIKRDRVDYELIGNKLVEIFSSLKSKLINEFALYCSIQEKQNELLASKSASSKFGQFRKTAEQHAKEVLNKLTLKDLLMAPVQRIMRYRLLIHSVFETFPASPSSSSSSNPYYGTLERTEDGRRNSQSLERDQREERRRKKMEDTERRGRQSLEMAVKVVQEIANGVNDKKAESERLDWVQKQLFPSSTSSAKDGSSSKDGGHGHEGGGGDGVHGSYVHGSRIITSMDSLILEHEGSVDWKMTDTYIPVHLLLLRDFIVFLSVTDPSSSSLLPSSSSISSLSPSSQSSSSNVPPTMSNRHSSASALLSSSGHPMSLACLSKTIPPTATVGLAKPDAEHSVIPIHTDLVVKPVAATPKAFYLMSTGKNKPNKAFMYEISTPDVEQCSKWIEKISDLVRFKSSVSMDGSSLVRLAPSSSSSTTSPPAHSSLRQLQQQQPQYTPYPVNRHGLRRHHQQQQPFNNVHVYQGPGNQQQQQKGRDLEQDQNEVNRQRLAQLRNRPLPPPPPPYGQQPSVPPPPARSDSIPGASSSGGSGANSGPRYVGRIEVMEPKQPINEFKSSVHVQGPMSGNVSNDAISYPLANRFNSDPFPNTISIVNNEYYGCLGNGSFDGEDSTADCTFDNSMNRSCSKDALIEINQVIQGLLLKKQQIISTSSSLPLGSTSLVFLTNQLIKESLDVENAFLNSTLTAGASSSPSVDPSSSRSAKSSSKSGSRSLLNDSISIEDRTFEEEKNKIRDKFSRILFSQGK